MRLSGKPVTSSSSFYSLEKSASSRSGSSLLPGGRASARVASWRAQAVAAAAAGARRDRGAATVHRIICSGDCARSLPGRAAAAEPGCSVCVPGGGGGGGGAAAAASQRPLQVSATLSARRLDARPQPAEGGARGAGRGPGAGRGGAGEARARAGRRVLGRRGTLPPPYLSPAPPDGRLRGRGLLEDNGRPLSPSQSPLTPGCGFSQSQSLPRVGGGISWAQRKVAGVLSSKRGAPRSVAARTVREDNRTPPAPGTLVLTLVSPPLPVLPSPSSRAGVRRRGRGPAVKKGHLTASPQLGHSSPGGTP